MHNFHYKNWAVTATYISDIYIYRLPYINMNDKQMEMLSAKINNKINLFVKV